MLEELKEKVFESNMDLVRHHLVIFTWGNVSAIDRASGIVAIKPSGVPYEEMRPEHMVLVDLDGKIIEGDMNPSSDTMTHLALYRACPEIGSVVHTHSREATAWAQAGKEIPCLGTTHSDYFVGNIPVTREMTEDEINHDYELNTGYVITERFRTLDYMQTPGVLVRNHGPFTWGKDSREAVMNAVILEEIAYMASQTFSINPDPEISEKLMEKHYQRKHGKNAYYGQPGRK